MTARHSVLLGTIALLGLAGTLVWLKLPATSQAVAYDPNPALIGLSVTSVADVDHLVERYRGPVGYYTLADQLAAINIELQPEDRYTAIPDPSLGVGSLIEITRATPVTIDDAGTQTMVRTWAASVETLLADLGIAVDEDDRVAPALSTLVEQDLQIVITRIGTSEESETEEMPFRTVTKHDANLEKGTKRTQQAGRPGLKRHTYEVTRENGREVKRVKVRTETVREPEDKVIVEGTKVVSYGAGQATWYALRSGMQAAHNTLPFGTWVKVTNPANGKSVDVQITDRGIQGGAIIDLTADAFKLIAPLGAGRIQVKLEKDWD